MYLHDMFSDEGGDRWLEFSPDTPEEKEMKLEPGEQRGSSHKLSPQAEEAYDVVKQAGEASLTVLLDEVFRFAFMIGSEGDSD